MTEIIDLIDYVIYIYYYISWYSHNVCAFRNSGIVYSGRMFQDSYQYPMLCQHFITVNFHCFHLIVTIACYGVDTIAIAAYWNENYDDESNESKMHNVFFCSVCLHAFHKQNKKSNDD